LPIIETLVSSAQHVVVDNQMLLEVISERQSKEKKCPAELRRSFLFQRIVVLAKEITARFLRQESRLSLPPPF